MSKEEKEETAEEVSENDDVVVKERKTRKIQINVSREKEIDALQKEKAELEAKFEKEREEREEKEQKLEAEKIAIQDELTEKQAILEKQALEAFDKDKKELLELAKSRSLSDEQMADIEERLTTPERLEMVKGLITMLAPKPEVKSPETEKKPPSGKATLVSPERKGDSEVFDSPEALMSKLYWQAYYAREGEVTVQERKQAIDKINKLFNALIGGKAWKQLRGGEQMPANKVTECPHCHEIIIGTPDKCPKCGWDLQEKLRRQGEEGVEW